MFHTKFVEKIKTYFTFHNFLSKVLSLWDKVGKYCRVGQATDDNMARVHCMLDI